MLTTSHKIFQKTQKLEKPHKRAITSAGTRPTPRLLTESDFRSHNGKVGVGDFPRRRAEKPRLRKVWKARRRRIKCRWHSSSSSVGLVCPKHFVHRQSGPPGLPGDIAECLPYGYPPLKKDLHTDLHYSYFWNRSSVVWVCCYEWMGCLELFFYDNWRNLLVGWGSYCSWRSLSVEMLEVGCAVVRSKEFMWWLLLFVFFKCCGSLSVLCSHNTLKL